MFKKPDYDDLPYEILCVRDGKVTDVVGRRSVSSEAHICYRNFANSIADDRYHAVLTYKGDIVMGVQ